MNGNLKKKAGVVILTSDKLDFIVKAITRYKEGHFIILKGAIQQEDITLVNIYAPNTGAPKSINKTSGRYQGRERQQYNHTRDFNTPLISLDKSSRPKKEK